MRRLEWDDLYRLAIPSDPQISPDGRCVAYVVTRADRDADENRSAIWASPTDGSPASQLTRGLRDTAPRWSPDGRALAFLRTESGDLPQLWLLPASGGESAQVTLREGGAGPALWNSDGTEIAFIAVDAARTADRPGAMQPGRESDPVVIETLGFKLDGAGLVGGTRHHLFVLSIASGRLRQVTTGDYSVAAAAWSPDGSEIAYAAACGVDRDLDGAMHVYTVAATGDETRRISSDAGNYAALAWLPDGEHVLAVRAPHDRVGHAGLIAIATIDGRCRELTPTFDRNVMVGSPAYPGAPPTVTPDGRKVLFCARERGSTHAFAVPVSGGKPAPIAGTSAGVVAGLTVARSVDRLALVINTSSSPGDIYVANLDGTDFRKLTDFRLPDVALVEPAERTFVTPNGTALHGWLIHDPAVPGPAPLLIDIHGGPHNAWNPAFDAPHLYHQILAAAGWIVLLLNPQGSDGYGETFFTAAVGQWGRANEGEFAAAIDLLVEQGIADPDRLAVSGYSYGAYMTCWLSARSDRFAAAVAGGCAVDLTSMVGTGDVGYQFHSLELGALPHENPERFDDLSPLRWAGSGVTPTLLLHGESDHRCPVGQAEQWFTSLRSRRIPAQLVRYPNAGHDFLVAGRPSHRLDYGRRLFGWLTEHVVGDTDTGACERGSGNE
jgi:dipeptidyl aminopeptidase/acylaminoacyl peptidase